MLLRADETTESELKVDTFLARADNSWWNNYGDQLRIRVFRDDSTLICESVGVSFLGPRGALKGFMVLTLEQATALAEFLDNHINGRAPISGSIINGSHYDFVDGRLTVTDLPAGPQVTA